MWNHYYLGASRLIPYFKNQTGQKNEGFLDIFEYFEHKF